MAWLACDIDGREIICTGELVRLVTGWHKKRWLSYSIKLPKGTVKHLIGRELTWEDEPVQLVRLISGWHEKRGVSYSKRLLIGRTDLA